MKRTLEQIARLFLRNKIEFKYTVSMLEIDDRFINKYFKYIVQRKTGDIEMFDIDWKEVDFDTCVEKLNGLPQQKEVTSQEIF